MKLQPIQKDDYIVHKIPHNYDKSADCPKFKEFLKKSVPDPKERKKLQEYVGYGLMKWTKKHEKALLLVGPTNTGKTVFLHTIEKLFGEEAVSNQSLQELCDDKYTVDKLKDKYVNIRHDLSDKDVQDVQFFKEIVSGNPMKAREIYESPIEFRPTAKLMFSANHFPTPKKNKVGDEYLNRWLIAKFPYSFSEEQQDKDLKQKLTTEDELEGILNWAVEGAQRLQKQGGFTNDRDTSEKMNALYGGGHSISRFIDEKIIFRFNADDKSQDFVEFSYDLYEAYKDFCDSNNLEEHGQRALVSELKKLPSVRKYKPMKNGKRRRGFSGVKLKED